MGFLQRSWQWLMESPNATFSESQPRPVDQVIVEMMGRGSALRVGRTEAFSVPAVLRGRNLICSSIATLPLLQYGPDRNVVPSLLLQQIDPDVPNVVTLSQTLEDLLFESVSWWRITGFGWDGYPTNATHLDVGTVSLEPPSGKSPAPLPSELDPRQAVVWVDGKAVAASEMIRFDSPNPGLLKVAGRAIRRAILLDQAAAMYADEPRPLDFFTPTEGADPGTDDDIRELLEEWKRARKTRGTAYVPAALKYNAVDQPTPADLQLVELQKRATLDIANAIGLDPEDLGISTTSRTYRNDISGRQNRVNDVYAPYMRAITDRLSMGDVTKRGHIVRFDLDDYMRADPLTRWTVYEKQYQMFGDAVLPEIRAEENMPALDSASTPAPTTNKAEKAVSEAVRASNATSLNLSADDKTGMVFADVPSSTFSVDEEKRTITGLAVPYNKVATNFFRKWRFDKGSLQFADISRVKLLRDHDRSQAIGRAIEMTDTPEGVVMKFRVARGPEGDRALALAADGVLDGLSVGVDFDIASDTVPDPTKKGVTLVRRADLREVSLTAMPAFDDSRVTSVAASRDGGNEMPDNQTGETTTVQPATFSMDALGAAIAAAMQGQNQPQEQEQRQVVNPTRLTASVEVNEAAPYRFDNRGNIQRGSHDFSTDLIAGSKGDAGALERAQTFVAAQFDVDRADATALNPTRNRPDMYVDQREYRYPVWQAINKGTLPDSTPFVFPKFNTASGLVNNHTEGVEPTPGTFTATSQTVTPTQVSGKVEITREAWDQGGNPQLSNLIWRQMNRAYYEALEAAAVAVLDAATPTAIALTAGGGTTGQTLSAELEAAFAALQFVRGGFSMDTMFAQVDLYKALAAAKDNDKRPLYPVIGPANANGTARSRFGALDVAGVLALPAWALAATGSVVASSYLFDSESVHGWATAPQRLQFEYRVAYVDLAIWGYKATAISDINGVRELTYDPVA